MPGTRERDPGSPSAWRPCERGEFQALSERLAGQQSSQDRRQFLRTAAAASVAILGGGAGLWFAFGRDDKPTYGNLTCAQVAELMPEYRVGRLAEAMTGRVRTHLRQCSHCGEKFDV